VQQRIFLFALALALAAAPAFGQVLYGSPTGTVPSQTNDAGGYTFSNLPPGTYDLTINATGFRTLRRSGIGITVNVLRREDLTLELGSREVVNIPLPRYRNYQSLINLVRGATPGQYQNSIQAAPARALSTNVNGVNRNNNATRIDGALSVFLWLPHPTAYFLAVTRALPDQRQVRLGLRLAW
jgi:hypothetical protein